MACGTGRTTLPGSLPHAPSMLSGMCKARLAAGGRLGGPTPSATAGGRSVGAAPSAGTAATTESGVVGEAAGASLVAAPMLSIVALAGAEAATTPTSAIRGCPSAATAWEGAGFAGLCTQALEARSILLVCVEGERRAVRPSGLALPSGARPAVDTHCVSVQPAPQAWRLCPQHRHQPSPGCQHPCLLIGGRQSGLRGHEAPQQQLRKVGTEAVARVRCSGVARLAGQGSPPAGAGALAAAAAALDLFKFTGLGLLMVPAPRLSACAAGDRGSAENAHPQLVQRCR